jgi:hypothetical protein
MARHELVGGKAIHDARRTGEEAEEVDRGRHLVDRRPDRLSGIRALESTELVGLGLERIGDLEEQQRAVLRRGLLPALERRLGGVDGAIDVLLRARGNVGDDLVIGRVDDLGGPAVGRVDEVAADELLVGLGSFERLGHGGASWAVTGRVGKCRHPSPETVTRPVAWARYQATGALDARARPMRRDAPGA